MTTVQLALAVGMDNSSISRIERGLNKTVPEATLERIARALRVDPTELKTDVLVENVRPAPSYQLRGTTHVPIVGLVEAGLDGFFVELEYPTGAGGGYVEAEAKNNNMYALEVRGDSMWPRIRSGEYIVIDPSKEPSAGDDVVVALKDGRKMVKELLYTRDGQITLGSINANYQPTTVQLDEVEFMHYVAARVPRGGHRELP
jgi:phage repressor protein C with HTH and peptisase S24 domain